MLVLSFLGGVWEGQRGTNSGLAVRFSCCLHGYKICRRYICRGLNLQGFEYVLIKLAAKIIYNVGERREALCFVRNQ
jgi:hypothetical protein